MMRIRTLGQKGVTFVELLVVMGMLAVFLTVIVTIFTAAVDTQSQSQGYSATLSGGRFITVRLDYDIARASAISAPASLGATSPNMVMTINGTTYTYTVNGGVLQLTDGGGTANLSDANVTVSALNFQRLGNSGGKETIRYTFTLTSTAASGSGKDTKTYTSTVERR